MDSKVLFFEVIKSDFHHIIVNYDRLVIFHSNFIFFASELI